MKKRNPLTVMVLFFSIITYSQNVSSPYSIIGIGDIETSYFNRTSGMANTGIAYRNDKNIILNNPASLSDIQSQLFLVDLAARGKFVNFSGPSIEANRTGKDFSVERLSLGIRISKWWGTSVGLMPYSTSNYTFIGTTTLQGTTITVPVLYDGDGGINRYYFANGFRITKNLSLGVNVSYLAGSLTQHDTLVSADLTTGIYNTRNIYLRNWYFDYGLQYHINVSKKWGVNIGATYANKTDLRAQTISLVTDQSRDTLSFKVLSNNFFTLPTSTGVGIAIIKDKKITFLADYRYQNWTSLNIKGLNYSLVNSSRYSAGFEYSKVKQYLGIPYETFNLQAGVFYNKSYLKISSEQLIDRGVTFGAGFNSKRNSLSYHLSVEVGARGSQSTPVKENYAGFTFGLFYKDFWNTKGRKYN